MLRFQDASRDGRLGTEARWLTRTRLVFLKKKGSDKPRPVRVGEFLRAAMAKKVQKRAAPKLRAAFAASRQWGVEMPGGCEALVHWRSLVEAEAVAGHIPPVVAFDLDLANMFGTILRERIRGALRRHFPEALHWTQWVHADDELMDLPQGGVAHTDRGSGQGDVFGPAASALTLGDA
eukprot:8093952-Pyramimonas_sp.AAC.1